MNLITVYYEENTVFTREIIRNGGADYNEVEAMADEMEKDMLVELTGRYEGADFYAASVRLVEVIS